MQVRLLMAGTLLCSGLLFGQKPEYDFYEGFRTFMSALWVKDPSTTSGQILEAYTEKLKTEGVPDIEISRRRRLLTTERPQLEADRWDRFYRDNRKKKDRNQSPNAFLTAFAADRRPGVALDYAMGTGRNVAMAQKRATGLGLKLHSAAVSDSELVATEC